MASPTLVSVGEYLATTYRPDRELLDGELVERNLGEYDHANLQLTLGSWIRQRRLEWSVRVVTEQRVQVGPGRFRIPDVCVISRDQEIEPVFTRPPLICIEILSKDDSLRSMQDRVDDYLDLGVANVWILDPAARRAYVCTRGCFEEPAAGVLEVPGTPVRIPLDELFAEFDNA